MLEENKTKAKRTFIHFARALGLVVSISALVATSTAKAQSVSKVALPFMLFCTRVSCVLILETVILADCLLVLACSMYLLLLAPLWNAMPCLFALVVVMLLHLVPSSHTVASIWFSVHIYLLTVSKSHGGPLTFRSTKLLFSWV